jgi:hypothetical protein
MERKPADSPSHRCCGSSRFCNRQGGMTRREFLADVGAVSAAGAALPAWPMAGAPRDQGAGRARPASLPLKVQPVLVYEIYERKQATSWRPWGGLLTEEDAGQEKRRIGRELDEVKSAADFPLEILPLIITQTPEQAAAASQGNHDVLLIYAASGDLATLEALTAPGKWNLMFLRHRSGPVYLWYEIAHPTYLRRRGDGYLQPGVALQDVVVDSYDEILMRLRALHGLRNAVGKRIVAVGGAAGWGRDGQLAPDHAREIWKLDIREVMYPQLGERIQAARADAARVARCRVEAEDYLQQQGVSLETSRESVANAFLLTEVFRDVLEEAQTDALTINHCMDTIMPLSETTACLSLSLLNDEGYLAFCESDFVVIPSGILLHYVSSKPVFLNDPTLPHEGVVTLAHCTAPRKMDGKRFEPARIMTHFESDYGAAPKVEMRKGQRVTVLNPDFSGRRWLGFEGVIVDNPSLHICRSQIDVEIKGDCDRLLQEMRGFHWMVSYGGYIPEIGYALKKAGVDWLSLT